MAVARTDAGPSRVGKGQLNPVGCELRYILVVETREGIDVPSSRGKVVTVGLHGTALLTSRAIMWLAALVAGRKKRGLKRMQAKSYQSLGVS